MQARVVNTAAYLVSLLLAPALWAYAAAFAMFRGILLPPAAGSGWALLSDGLIVAALLTWLGLILASSRFGPQWQRRRDLPLLVLVPPTVFFLVLRFLIVG